jgi:hypothetical protein
MNRHRRSRFFLSLVTSLLRSSDGEREAERNSPITLGLFSEKAILAPQSANLYLQFV